MNSTRVERFSDSIRPALNEPNEGKTITLSICLEIVLTLLRTEINSGHKPHLPDGLRVSLTLHTLKSSLVQWRTSLPSFNQDPNLLLWEKTCNIKCLSRYLGSKDSVCLRSVPAGFNSLEGDESLSGSEPAADVIQRKITARLKHSLCSRVEAENLYFFSTCQTLKCLFMQRYNAQLCVCVCVFCSLSMLDLRCCGSFRCWESEAWRKKKKKGRKGYLLWCRRSQH